MRILYLLPALLLSACASQPKPVVSCMPKAAPGTTLTSEATETVRYSENLKAYPIGRYIDPNNSLVMHEQHLVYRVETTAKWNLHPHAPAAVPLGPIIRAIDPSHKEAPLTAEIIAEVSKQKAATQVVIKQGARINQTLTQLSTALNENRQTSEQNAQLKKELDMTKQRLDLLEAELRSQQKETPASGGIPQTTNQQW